MILLIYYLKIVVRKISYFNIIILCNLITLWFKQKKNEFSTILPKNPSLQPVVTTRIYIHNNNLSAAVEIILRRLR